MTDVSGLLLAERYRLGAPLGRGGMAEVVLAHDERLDRRVAVKLMADEGIDAVTRRRFLDEARAGARFSHPNAVAVHDAGRDNGWMFLVMEVVDGPSLADRLAEHGPLPAAEAAAITARVLDALAAAHAVGLVHRDVKPANVLFAADGTVKVADFGIAKRLDAPDPELTGTGQFIGTPRYLAPEQLLGEPSTPASDVYATGVVLFEMLTGRPPFTGDHPLAIALAHRDAPVPDLTRRAPATPPAVIEVVRRALAKRPEDRFADAAAMAAALRAAATPEPSTPPQTVGPIPGPSAPAASADAGRPVQTGVAPVPTAVAPVPMVIAPARSRRRHRFLAIVVALVAVAALAVAARACADPPLDTISGPTSVPAGAAADSVPAPTAATGAPVGAATTGVSVGSVREPPERTGPAPDSVEALLAVLGADPDAFGDAGPELRDRLLELADLNGRGRRDAAARLADDAARWIDEGRLDPALGMQTVAVVLPLSEPPGQRDEDGNDEGDD